jgi:hypothetical protein
MKLRPRGCAPQGPRLGSRAHDRGARRLIAGAAEGWPSGRWRTLGKRVYGQPYRGFESHSLRQPYARECRAVPVTYFAGRDRTKLRAASNSLRRSASSPKAAGPARTQPCMRRPRDIIGTTSGVSSAQSSLFLPSLASIPSSRAPHRRLPLSSHARPPNMVFSVSPGSVPRSSRKSSSRPSSRANLPVSLIVFAACAPRSQSARCGEGHCRRPLHHRAMA